MEHSVLAHLLRKLQSAAVRREFLTLAPETYSASHEVTVLVRLLCRDAPDDMGATSMHLAFSHVLLVMSTQKDICVCWAGSHV